MPEPMAGHAARLIAQHPLAWVISRSFAASPLPLLAEFDEGGEISALLGHCANSNPLLADYRRDPRGLVLFNGPSGYVSPRLISRSDWAPTWNYAALHFEVEVELVPAETPAALERLLDHLEEQTAERWTIERMGARYHKLLARITAFRAHVRRFDPRFKLGQDESGTDFAEIVRGHPDRALANWMTAVAGQLQP